MTMYNLILFMESFNQRDGSLERKYEYSRNINKTLNLSRNSLYLKRKRKVGLPTKNGIRPQKPNKLHSCKTGNNFMLSESTQSTYCHCSNRKYHYHTRSLSIYDYDPIEN